MKFRKRLFYGLALLGAIYIVATIANTGNFIEERAEVGSESAATVGAGIGIVVLLVCGVPVVLGLALLGWRNGVGIRNAQRHREMLEAQGGPHPRPLSRLERGDKKGND